MKRRKFLIGTAAAATAASAGCLDILADGVEAEAEPAKVPEQYAAEYDYEHIDLEPFRIDEEIEFGDETRDIKITTWTATYAKDADDLAIGDFDDLEADAEDFLDQQGAGFGVVSTPSESIAGQEVNPIARLDEEDIIEEFNAEIAEGDVRDLERVDEHPATMLGEEVDIGEFDAVVETEDGDEFDITLYVAEAHSEDDIILAVGAHPQMADETENVIGMVEAVEHPVDADADAEDAEEREDDE